MPDVTQILTQVESGGPAATEQLLPMVYDEVRRMIVRLKLLACVVLVEAHLIAALQAQSLLRVDFNSAGVPVQTGFLGMVGSQIQTSANSTFGSYTVGLAGQGFGTANNTNSGFLDESLRGLYRDYYYHNSDVNGVGVNLSIGGVLPNTTYNLKLWSYDADQLFSVTPTVWNPVGNSSGSSGSVTNFALPRPTSLDDFSTTIQISSTTSTLDVFGTTTSGHGGTRLNGFKLDDGVTDLLAVDFGHPAVPASPVQAGFSNMSGSFPLGPDSPPPSKTATFGSYTVTVSGDPHTDNTYHRIGFENTAASATAIDSSIRALYEDALVNNLDTNVGRGLNLSIQGVTPNAQYMLKLWSYNADNTLYPTPTTFSPMAGSDTTGTSGTVTQFATPLPTSLNDYSTTIIVSSTTNTLDIHAASIQNQNGNAYGGTRLNGFELSLVPTGVPGDYNGNQVVDAADYAVWRKHKGITVGAIVSQGDGDGDGDVDDQDYAYWRNRFGNTSGSGTSHSGAVPEANSFGLILVSLAFGIPLLSRRVDFRH